MAITRYEYKDALGEYHTCVRMWLMRPIRDPHNLLQCGHILLRGSGGRGWSRRAILAALRFSRCSFLFISNAFMPSLHLALQAMRSCASASHLLRPVRTVSNCL